MFCVRSLGLSGRGHLLLLPPAWVLLSVLPSRLQVLPQHALHPFLQDVSLHFPPWHPVPCPSSPFLAHQHVSRLPHPSECFFWHVGPRMRSVLQGSYCQCSTPPVFRFHLRHLVECSSPRPFLEVPVRFESSVQPLNGLAQAAYLRCFPAVALILRSSRYSRLSAPRIGPGIAA